MAKILETYNFGNPEDLTNERLIELLSRMYTDIAQEINRRPSVFIRTTDGQTTDIQLSVGDININSGTFKIEMLVDHPTQATVTWKEI